MLAGIQSVLFIICVSFVSPFDSRLWRFRCLRSFFISFLFHFFHPLCYLMRLCSYLILNINKFRSQITLTACVHVYMCICMSERMNMCIGMECSMFIPSLRRKMKQNKIIEWIYVYKQWNDCRPTTVERLWHTEKFAVRICIQKWFQFLLRSYVHRFSLRMVCICLVCFVFQTCNATVYPFVWSCACVTENSVCDIRSLCLCGVRVCAHTLITHKEHTHVLHIFHGC